MSATELLQDQASTNYAVIIQLPDWNLPIDIMYGTSDH